MQFTIENSCTGISEVYQKVFLDITEKSKSASTTINFGSPNRTNYFPKSHHTIWSDIIYFIPLAATIPNNVIQYRYVRILRYPYRYGMYPGYQKSRNTMTNGVSDSIVLIIFCASRDHEFTNWQYA